MTCADVDELLPGLALGAATPSERQELEQHLAGCDRHPLYADFEEIAAMLPFAAPPASPRHEVKNRLMARVYGDLDRQPWWRRAQAWAVAAVLAVVALGLGIRDMVVSNQLAGAPVIWQIGSTGTLVYLPQQHTATLMLQQLPQLPPDRVYEAWLIKDGKPQPAGVFRPSADGAASLIVKGSPIGYNTVAVTEEPGPNGSAAPTSPPFLAGSLQ